MVASLPNNPYTTTVGTGLFIDPSANGLVQGTAYPDPATRYQLRRGWLSNNETIPMWGGVAIYEFVPGGTTPYTNPLGVAVGPLISLGVQVGRATTVTGGSYPIAGFSVFDQAYAMVNNPASQVPLAGSYGQVNSYRLGSGARIAVACDPALVSLENANINAAVGWDLVNQILVPHTGSINVSSGTYNSTTGLVTLTLASSPGISPGTTVVVAGLTGTGSYASANGTFTAATGTTGTTLTYYIATTLTLTISTTGTITTGTALPNVSVLEVITSGCMTVAYTSATTTANWNYNGACAVIQI